jgi:hypothetical protein
LQQEFSIPEDLPKLGTKLGKRGWEGKKKKRKKRQWKVTRGNRRPKLPIETGDRRRGTY